MNKLLIEGPINRYYDPSTDQYLSVDPMVNETNQPYAFTGDDPVNGTDPMGLHDCGWTDPLGCVGDVGGAIGSTVAHHWRGILTATAVVGGIVVTVGTGGSAILGEGLVATALDTAVNVGTVATTAANTVLCGITSGSGEVIACAGAVTGLAAPYINALGADDTSFWYQGKYIWSVGVGGSLVVAGWATAANAETASKC